MYKFMYKFNTLIQLVKSAVNPIFSERHVFIQNFHLGSLGQHDATEQKVTSEFIFPKVYISHS